jgi:hypothetical protein
MQPFTIVLQKTQIVYLVRCIKGENDFLRENCYEDLTHIFLVGIKTVQPSLDREPHVRDTKETKSCMVLTIANQV